MRVLLRIQIGVFTVVEKKFVGKGEGRIQYGLMDLLLLLLEESYMNVFGVQTGTVNKESVVRFV